MAPTLPVVLARLESLGTERMRAQHRKRGAGDNQYGVPMGAIRKLAKELKKHPELVEPLWQTGNIDAQLLAILLIKPKALSEDELDAMVRSGGFHWVADWLNAYVVKKHPARETLRQRWLSDSDPLALRAAWNLTSIRVEKEPEGLDLDALLDRLEAELAGAHEMAQWTMNFTLVAIGIHHPGHRARAVAIGEALGLYRDWPVPRGCTSPFAPLWIEAMVARG